MFASSATAAPASLSKCARIAPPIAIVGLRRRQRVTNRSFVERARTLFEARDPTEAGRERSLPCEAGAKGVDRLHGKTRRMLRQVPSLPGVLSERLRRELPRQPFVRRRRRTRRLLLRQAR